MIDAPAKVNLRLVVLAREESGYHALETLFCAIGLSDSIEIRRGEPGIRLEVEGGIETGPAERNLAVLAAERFYRETGEEPGIGIRLLKRIPSEGGLGGGSSDAAAVLVALNALHGEPLPRAALLQAAVELGADVPFFLCGSPLALAWGRGERLLALPPLAERPVLVAHPGTGVSTAEAFRALAARRLGEWRPVSSAVDAEALSSWERVAPMAVNDFEPGVADRVPMLREALRAMKAFDAGVAMLSGSGSSVFGVFASDEARDEAAARVEGMGLRCWRTATLAEMPAPRLDFREASG